MNWLTLELIKQMEKVVIMLPVQILSADLSHELYQELGLDNSRMNEIYQAYQKSNSLFESHFVIEEPFEKVLMLKVAREFFMYNKSKEEIESKVYPLGNCKLCAEVIKGSDIDNFWKEVLDNENS